MDQELWQPRSPHLEERVVWILLDLEHRGNVLEEWPIHRQSSHVEIWSHRDSYRTPSTDLRRMGVLQGHQRDYSFERIQPEQEQFWWTSPRWKLKLKCLFGKLKSFKTKHWFYLSVISLFVFVYFFGCGVGALGPYCAPSDISCGGGRWLLGFCGLLQG